MPNSSGGKQEEEMEVGEEQEQEENCREQESEGEEQEQEKEQEQEQGEEQVVKRRIAVSKMPTSRRTSEKIRSSLQVGICIVCVNEK